MADISKLKPNGATGTEYNIIDDDYRNTDHTFTMNTYSSYSHTFESTQISQRMPVRNVFTAIQSLFNSLKTAINDHGSLFGDIATALAFRVTKDNATYKALNFHSYDHTIDDSMELTTQFDGAGEMGSVWFANTNLGVVTDAVNDHAEWIAKETAGSKTVTGNPLTITDASPNKAEKIEIDFEPQQDKHGYNSVWVGGAGKNYVDYSNKHSSDVGNTTESNSYTGELKVIWANGYAHQLVLSIPNGISLAGKTITLSYDSVIPNSTRTADWRIFLLSYVNGSSESIIATLANGAANHVTLTVANNVTELRLLLRLSQSGSSQSGDYVIWNKVQIELGSSATPYEPHENICPITGYTFLSANRCGKNLANTISNFNNMSVSGNQTDSVGCVAKNSVADSRLTLTCRLYYYNGNTVITSDSVTYSGSDISYTFTIPANTTKLVFGHSGATYNATIELPLNDNIKVGGTYTISCHITSNNPSIVNGLVLDHIMIRKSTVSDATFAFYNGYNVTVQFGQTLYGGKLTILQDGSADVDVDTAYYKYVGNETWSIASSGNCRCERFTDMVQDSNGVCSHLPTGGANGDAYFGDGVFIIVNGRDTYNLNSTNAVQAFTTNMEIAYKLATPFTIHLSPVETLTLLQGINNVWTDGTSLSLTYQPDNAIGQAKGTAVEVMDYAQEIARDNYSRNLFNAENPYGGYTGTISSYNEESNETTITGQWYQAWIIDVEPNTNYTYSRTNISATVSRDSAIYGVQSNGRPDTTDAIKTSIVATDNIPTTITFNSGNREKVAILIYSGNSNSGTTVVKNIQLVKGENEIAYEPYIPTNKELLEMIKALQQSS